MCVCIYNIITSIDSEILSNNYISDNNGKHICQNDQMSCCSQLRLLKKNQVAAFGLREFQNIYSGNIHSVQIRLTRNMKMTFFTYRLKTKQRIVQLSQLQMPPNVVLQTRDLHIPVWV